MAISLVCSSTANGLPEGCTSGNPMRVMSGFYRIAKGTTMTYANASTLSYYIGLVIAKTLLPVHGNTSVEDASIEKKVEETNLGRKKLNHPGYRGYMLKYDLTPDEHQAIKAWEDDNFDIIPYDALGTIYFAKASTDGYVSGFGIDFFNVEKIPVATAEASATTVIEIQETDSQQLDNFLYIQPKKQTAIADRWAATDVKTISKATVTQSGSVTANVFVVDVTLDSTSKIVDSVLSSKAVTGLLLANFLVNDGAGATVVPTDVTETAGTPGEYTITCTTYTGGTCELAPQAADDNLYESDAATIT